MLGFPKIITQCGVQVLFVGVGFLLPNFNSEGFALQLLGFFLLVLVDDGDFILQRSVKIISIGVGVSGRFLARLSAIHSSLRRVRL